MKGSLVPGRDKDGINAGRLIAERTVSRDCKRAESGRCEDFSVADDMSPSHQDYFSDVRRAFTTKIVAMFDYKIDIYGDPGG